MKYEDRFEDGSIVDLNVKNYPDGAFKYKPQNADEESDWLPLYMKLDGKGKPITDFKMLNKLKLNHVVEVPFSKELLKKISGIEKEWKDMNIDEKWAVFGKLKGNELDNILIPITNIDMKSEDQKKD